jgi:hypothetical protein
MSITFQGKDFKVFDLNNIAANGGTATATYAIPTNYVVLIRATILGCYATTSPTALAGSAGLQAEFVASNYAGTGATPTALPSGVNPANSSTTGLLGADAQGSDINGSSPIAAAWTRSGTNAVLTVTNNYTSNIDALVYMEIYPAKNV